MIGAPVQYPASLQSVNVDIKVWRDLAMADDGAVLARNVAGGYVIPDASTPPIITLRGSNPMTVVQGSQFTDPGATATNVYGDPLTSSIVVVGSVNTATPGNYLLTYTASDEVGDMTTTTRAVIVVPQQITPTPTPTPVTPTPTPVDSPTAPSPSPESPDPTPQSPVLSPSPAPAGESNPSGDSGYFEPVIPFNPNGPTDFGSDNGGGGGSDNSDDLLGGSGHIGSNGSTLGYAIAVVVNTVDTPRAAASDVVDAGIGWSQNQLTETARSLKKKNSNTISAADAAPTQTPVVALVLGVAAAITLGALVPAHFVLGYALIFYPILALLLLAVGLKLYKKYMGFEIPPPPSGPRDTFS